jgi:hypothetical protein
MRIVREKKLLDPPHVYLREGRAAPDGSLIRERTAKSTTPLYLRDGDPITEDVDPGRVIYIKRTYVDAPQREEEKLPVAVEQPSPVADPAPRQERLEYPNLGLA